jgi:hypothetical protein
MEYKVKSIGDRLEKELRSLAFDLNSLCSL